MGYQFKNSETVADGVRRITLDQIDKALDYLNLNTRNKDRAIHQARVCFKKIRAVTRLVRSELGEEVYKQENLEYRDAGRRLSAVRDTVVVARALDDVSDEFGKQLEDADIRWLRKRLLKSKAKQQLDRKRVLSEVAETVSAARRRVDMWPIDRDGFEALRPGLQRIYKRGLVSFTIISSEPSTERLHEWRKQVKYLWYHVCVLNPVWPNMLDVLGSELNTLADHLSGEHDLALLKTTALEHVQDPDDVARIEPLLQLIDGRRAELQEKASALGARLYAEKPKLFAGRLQRYWEQWQPPRVSEADEASRTSEASFEATAAQ